MASDPHNKEGKHCACCGRELHRQSFTGTISVREQGFIVKKTSCIDCMNKHYSRGE